MNTLIIKSLNETAELGKKIGEHAFDGMIITLSGDLGAGKTTLTKSIGKAIGVTRTINSPTFTLLKSYNGKFRLNHIDAYRLENGAQDLGFNELFDDGITVIEWPQFMEDYLPDARLEISIERLSETKRKFTFMPHGSKYEALLKEIL